MKYSASHRPTVERSRSPRNGTRRGRAEARPWPTLSLRVVGVAVSVIVALAVSACGGSSSSTTTASKASSSSGDSATQASLTTHSYSTTVAGYKITTDPKLAAEVPQSVRQEGALKDVTDNNSPPDENIINGRLAGWEVDLGAAVAAKLGVRWEPTASGAFDSFIPSLQNGRFNTSFTSFIETPARLKAIDIVTFYNVGTGFAVKKGSPITISRPTDVCGHSVAVIEASAFIQQIQGIDCKGAGKAPANVQSFPSNAAAELAVASGRSEVYSSSDDQLSSLIAKTAHQFVLQPLDFEPVPVGAGVTKGIKLAKPIADAMDSLISSGAYAAIMKKWSITRGLVQQATLYTNDGGA